MRLCSLAFLILVLCTVARGEDGIPSWVLPGILNVETRSHYADDGHIIYVDQRRGADGEIGPFQMTRIAFRQIQRHGDDFWRMETDRFYAEEMTRRYLVFLYETAANHSWHRAVAMYNCGPADGTSERARSYAAAVEHAGRRALTEVARR